MTHKWKICGLLLLALLLNYMDRQTLSLTISPISRELGLNNAQYGEIERGFSLAFAYGGLVAGFLVDRFNVRWLYPLFLLGWSLAGVATGYADWVGRTLAPFGNLWWTGGIDPQNTTETSYFGFWICRTILGAFEAGQWPCALVATQRLLSAADRPAGNSVLQSGASLGAILTPLVIEAMVTDAQGSWRLPYPVIGIAGLAWIFLWLGMTKNADFLLKPKGQSEPNQALSHPTEKPFFRMEIFLRLTALAIVVIAINAIWQFYRAWMPKMLEEHHHYSPHQVRWFVVLYFIVTDLGCLSAGFLARRMSKGLGIHGARVLIYGICSLLCIQGTLASSQPGGPILLGSLLVVGFGALGLFPIFYSLTQELSERHQGKVTGFLSFVAWITTAEIQKRIGQHVDKTGSHADGMFWISLFPLVGLAALILLWPPQREKPMAKGST